MITFLTDTLGWRFLLALVLSVSLWSRLTLEQNPERRDVYPTEIPVEVVGLPNNLVVANEIQPVRVRIGAPQDSWRLLELPSFRATVNLSDARPGLHQPEVHVDVSDPQVRILQVTPAKVSVRIEELRTVTVPVRINQIGSPPFGYRIVGQPTSTPPEVHVSGPSSAIERVTEAAVSVRMEEVRSTIDRSLKPEPRGPSGVVSGVRVEPQSVTVSVQIEQIAGSKSVSIVPVIRGQPAPGYWIGAITVEPPAVQIVGEPGLLETVTVLNTADVDVSGAQSEVVRSVTVNRPAGITLVGDATATIRVAVQPVPSQQIRDVLVEPTNVAEELAASVTPNPVSLTLTGPQPALLRLDATELRASVDAAGLPPGSHALPVTVTVPNGIRVDRVTPDTVTVTLTPRS